MFEDKDLLDMLEDGHNIPVNTHKLVPKKATSLKDKKKYKLHHKARSIMVSIVSFKKYLNS